MANTYKGYGLTPQGDAVPYSGGSTPASVREAENAQKLGGVPADDYALKTDTAPNAEKLGGKAPEYYATADSVTQLNETMGAIDLLDNGDFSVAQAGYPVWDADAGKYTSGYHGAELYAADRWIFEQNNAPVEIVRDGENVTLTNSSVALSILVQRLSELAIDQLKHGTQYTLAVYFSDGEVLVTNGTYNSPRVSGNSFDGSVVFRDGWNFNLYQDIVNDRPRVRVYTEEAVTVSFKRIRLLPGTFTAETLPPYVPKPYGVELAECQRYFERIGYAPDGGLHASCCFATTNNGDFRVLQGYKQTKRVNSPTILVNGVVEGGTVSMRNSVNNQMCTGTLSIWNNIYPDRLNTFTLTGGTSDTYGVYEAYIDVCADL